MNLHPSHINWRTRSIKKTLQCQFYLDKSNLFSVPVKRKVLHRAKHKFIQNIMVSKAKNLRTSKIILFILGKNILN
jgi:hypothetical protein